MPFDLNQPPVVAALVGGGVAAVVSLIVAGISQFSGWLMHNRKIAADRDLAERKIEADIDLAERRFRFDSELAERRFRYDRNYRNYGDSLLNGRRCDFILVLS